jgi:peptidoglycan/LPS O-acetylase OafA/YrhL
MSKFLPYILNLRGAAIFFVVGAHASGYLADWSSQPRTQHLVRSIFDAHEGNGTVIFIFIGGFLFHHLTQRNFDFRKYIEKKFQYVISPYILISVPIIAYRIYTNYGYTALPPGFNDQSVVVQSFYYLITGLHMAPFWFISTIVLFYLSAPFLHAMDNPKVFRYVFPLILISCLFTFRSAHNANPILSYLHYFPVYFLGMWASYSKEKILAKEGWLLYILLIAYAIVYVSILEGWVGTPDKVSFEHIIQDRLLVFNVYMLQAVLLCFTLMLVFHKFKDIKMPFLEMLGEYSFGIFFVHCPVIFGFRRIWIAIFGPLDFSLLTFVIYFGIVILASTASIFFIKKLTGRYSRNLIGS